MCELAIFHIAICWTCLHSRRTSEFQMNLQKSKCLPDTVPGRNTVLDNGNCTLWHGSWPLCCNAGTNPAIWVADCYQSPGTLVPWEHVFRRRKGQWSMEWFVNAAKSSLTPRLATFRSWVNCWPCLRPHWRRAWSFNMPLSFTTLGSLASQYIPTSTPWTPRGEAQGALTARKVGVKGRFLHKNHGFYARYYGEILIFFPKTTSIISRKGDDL